MPPRKPKPAETDSAIAAPAFDPPRRWRVDLDRGVTVFTGVWQIKDGALFINPDDGEDYVLSSSAWRRLQEMP